MREYNNLESIRNDKTKKLVVNPSLIFMTYKMIKIILS